MEIKESENLEGLNVRETQSSMLPTLPVRENLRYTEESFSLAALYPVGDQIHGVAENNILSPGFSSVHDYVSPEQIRTSVFSNPTWHSFVPDHTHYERPLESEFSALNISDAPHPAAFMVAQPDYGGAVYTGGDPVNFHSQFDLPPEMMGFPYTNPQVSNGSLQKLRAQSAANGNTGLFIQPQNRTFCGNLQISNPFPVNGNFNPSPICDLNGAYNLPQNLNGNFHRNGLRLSENRNCYPNFGRGNLLLAAKDQHGCRLLQKKLLQGTPEERNMIFSGLVNHVCDLMVDQFGNYLIQTIFEVCSVDQMDQLLWLVTDDLLNLLHVCLDIRGAKAMQKMLEHLKTREQTTHVLSVLTGLTVLLSKSKIGQHVIHHCLKSFSHEETKHILNEVATHCVEIAADQDGCRVLKQCVSHAEGELQDRLLAEIAANSLFLSEHAYGNYVVQYLVELRIPHVIEGVLARLSGNFVALSLNKHGSHVVEKCMKYSGGDQVMAIINEIIHSPKFLTVLQDPYGNFVAQSALKYSKGSFLHKNMVTLILEHYPFLHSHPHGQRVLTKIKGSKNLGDHVKYVLRSSRV
ncbi:pumilio12-like [Dorcoceras hygrometricum]|uniref:Pumilio12-like n=1 Tax=Dorcoceras hygrometricum TaxID=472368 RepID=A0A2Z7C2R0_9LAMI|nr:pumilio12-like [Dorcoceras hygrometricum]